MKYTAKAFLVLALCAFILSVPWASTLAQSIDPPKVQFTLDKQEAAIGEPITVTWVITGGDNPPYTYNQWNSGWIVFDGEENQRQFVYGNVSGNSNTWTPAFGTRAYFSLSLLDADGHTPLNPADNSAIHFDSKEIPIKNGKVVAPLQVSVSLDKDNVNVNEAITATVQANGGEPPYTFKYRWIVMDQIPGPYTLVKEEETSSTNSVLRPAFSVQGGLTVTVRDSVGRSEYEMADFTITGGQTVDQKAEQVVAECKAKASGAYAQAKWLHDYLNKTADYDHTYTHYHASGVLMLGTGVCNSYAEAYQMLLNKAGITSRLVSGTADGVGGWGDHAWNLVLLGGNWYHVDVTWNESWGHEYFLRSDSRMSTDHRWKTADYPAAPYDWGKAPAVTALPGDANNDQTVDIRDLVSVIDHIVSGTQCKNMVNADANGDEAVDIRDLVWIIEKIVAG